MTCCNRRFFCWKNTVKIYRCRVLSRESVGLVALVAPPENRVQNTICTLRTVVKQQGSRPRGSAQRTASALAAYHMHQHWHRAIKLTVMRYCWSVFRRRSFQRSLPLSEPKHGTTHNWKTWTYGNIGKWLQVLSLTRRAPIGVHPQTDSIRNINCRGSLCTFLSWFLAYIFCISGKLVENLKPKGCYIPASYSSNICIYDQRDVIRTVYIENHSEIQYGVILWKGWRYAFGGDFPMHTKSMRPSPRFQQV